MMLNILSILMIVLIMLYLSSQGFLSSILALVTSLFASVLAMALFEPLQGFVAGYRPDYARGVTMLLIFFLGMSGLRIAADMIVPKNIVLPSWLDRSLGGVTGFLTGLIVVGTT